ncbi:hypothetical protein ACHWQZ_G005028 [Mnemiopsis leidyi]
MKLAAGIFLVLACLTVVMIPGEAASLGSLDAANSDSNAVLYGADHEILESSLINRKEEAEGALYG